MKINKGTLETLERHAKVNRNTGKEYAGKFEKRVHDNKVVNKLEKLTDEEMEMFYKIINNESGTFRTALTNYFKVLGILRDLPNFMIAKECIKRGIVKVED